MQKFSIHAREVHHLVLLVATLFVLFGLLFPNVDGNIYFALSMQHQTTVSPPPVLLQAGTVGSSTIYMNNTSAKTSVAAPAPTPTYYPSSYSISSGNYYGWYDSGWNYRKKITVNHTQVQADSADFPVLINLTSDSDLASHSQSNGNDILFTSSDGVTKLSHEIEKYTNNTGALFVWVKVLSLSSSVDTDLYMYYGNPTCSSQQDAINVWNSNFKGVWHLKEDPSGTAPQMKDSTSNGNNGTSSGSMTTSDQVEGRIDGSLDLDGTNDEVQCGNAASLQITTEVTIEAWVKRSSTAAIYAGIAGKLEDGAYDGYNIQKYDVTNRYRFVIGTGSGLDVNCVSDSAYTDTSWHYIVGVRRAGTNYLYVDGVQQAATSTQAITDGGVNFDIGRQYTNYNGRWWNGIIDEVRVSNIGRNASWIAICFNNQNSSSTFYTVGTQEENPAPGSLQTVDSNYFVVRSAASANSTLACNPSDYNLLGNTTYVSGATSNLTSNDGAYMTFRSHTNNDVHYYYNESLGQSDTGSTAYQDKVMLTFTPPTAGDYVIIADAEVKGSNTLYNSLARLYIGTSTYQELIRSIKNTGDWYPFNTLKRLSLSAATTMKIQFCSSSTFQTTSIRNARLIALKVPSEYAENETRVTTTSTSWQDRVTLTFTPATAGDYLIIATSNLDGSSTSYDYKWRLLQDNATEHANVVRRPGAATGRYNVGVMRTITLSAASHNFTIQYCSSSTSGTAGIGYAHVIAIRVDQFPNSYYQESEAESNPPVAGTWYNKVTSTYTPQAGDHLIIGTIHHTSASTSYSVGIRLNQNGVTVTDRLIEQTATTDYDASFSFTKASLSAASNTDAMQYMGESTATKVKMARIISLQLFEQIEVEFTGSSNTETWTQLAWTIDSAWTTSSVTATIQLYNYTLGGYPTSGNGYYSYTSSSTANTDETQNQTITTNSTNFRDASGNWKIKIRGVKNALNQFDLKVDWIKLEVTYYTEYTVSTEFFFSSMTKNTPTQLNFTVVSQYNVASVNVTIQVWNYSSPGYAQSGQGYLNYTSSGGSNETETLSINTNSSSCTSSGNARIKITGVKTTITQYQQEINQVKILYSYSASSTYDYVLKVVNNATSAWKIRLKTYSESNISRLNNCTIYFHNASDGFSGQVYIVNGNYTQQTGPWYDLPASPTERYIAIMLQADNSEVSYINIYLEILIPDKTTYAQYVVTFEIT